MHEELLEASIIIEHLYVTISIGVGSSSSSAHYLTESERSVLLLTMG